MANRISRSRAVVVLTILKHRFPWLGTEDEVSGADVVTDLNNLVELLEGISVQKRTGNGLGGHRPGSGRPEVAADMATIIKLREEGKSWSQIAEMLGISVRTAQRRVNNGK